MSTIHRTQVRPDSMAPPALMELAREQLEVRSYLTRAAVPAVPAASSDEGRGKTSRDGLSLIPHLKAERLSLLASQEGMLARELNYRLPVDPLARRLETECLVDRRDAQLVAWFHRARSRESDPVAMGGGSAFQIALQVAHSRLLPGAVPLAPVAPAPWTSSLAMAVALAAYHHGLQLDRGATNRGPGWESVRSVVEGILRVLLEASEGTGPSEHRVTWERLA